MEWGGWALHRTYMATFPPPRVPQPLPMALQAHQQGAEQSIAEADSHSWPSRWADPRPACSSGVQAPARPDRRMTVPQVAGARAVLGLGVRAAGPAAEVQHQKAKEFFKEVRQGRRGG